MIYITGDTHGDRGRFAAMKKAGEPRWTEKDTLIVCGDFGYIFTKSRAETAFLDELAKKPYTICFVDGNHENFQEINSCDLERWNGGFIHRIRRNILHLTRGQVFTIEGKRFFTMGGAYSQDRFSRRKNESYWEEELPGNEDYREASANLRRCGFQVDYILTHTAPREVIVRMGHCPDPHDDELTGFLEWVMHETAFKTWFFGHWHEDRRPLEHFRALFTDVVPLKEEG